MAWVFAISFIIFLICGAAVALILLWQDEGTE